MSKAQQLNLYSIQVIHPENLILQLFGNMLVLMTWHCPAEASGTTLKCLCIFAGCKPDAHFFFSFPLQVLLCQLAIITVAGWLGQQSSEKRVLGGLLGEFRVALPHHIIVYLSTQPWLSVLRSLCCAPLKAASTNFREALWFCICDRHSQIASFFAISNI